MTTAPKITIPCSWELSAENLELTSETRHLPRCEFPLFRLHRLRYHHLPLEIFHHVFVQPHFCGLPGERYSVDFVLQAEQRVKQILRTRWAADHVNINRDDSVHTLQHGICIERSADRRACTHRNHPLRLRHLVVDALHYGRHLQRYRTRDNHEVCLPRAGTKDLRPEARNIKSCGRRGDHLDGAAGQAKRHRPEGRLTRPVEDVVHRRDHEVLFELVLQPAHEASWDIE